MNLLLNRKVIFLTFIFVSISCGETNPPSYSESNLYVFGDSLSDVGNARLSTAGLWPDKNYYEGRFSNGPNYADLVAIDLNTPLKPSRSFGSNYAFGGARTLEMNAQVFNYKENVAGAAKQDAIYIVWSGGNDLLQFFPTAFSDDDIPTDAESIISNAMDNMENAIRSLAGMGAEKIVVPNQPNLARLPRIIELDIIAPGTALSAQNLTTQFNTALDDLLTSLANNDGLETISVDIFALFESIASDPAANNLSNITDRCYAKPDFILELTGDEEICVDRDEYLFWDGIHPSATGHAILADAFLQALGV